MLFWWVYGPAAIQQLAASGVASQRITVLSESVPKCARLKLGSPVDPGTLPYGLVMVLALLVLMQSSAQSMRPW